MPSVIPELRFAFGANWLTLLDAVDEPRLARAEASIRTLLGVERLDGARFLDAGCGSGLFSLAARRLGASVVSFDIDRDSVRCAEALRERFAAGDARWTIGEGSVLDAEFLKRLGEFDVVYSWGVLHHTGDLWRALENVMRLVSPGGHLAIAIYNDQGFGSRVWRRVKQAYNRLPPRWRFLVLWPAFVRLWAPTFVRDICRGHPFRTWLVYRDERGMSPLVDVRDWVGGYPFEVASPEKVVDFCSGRSLKVQRIIRRTGLGCNEYAFTRQ